MNFLLSSFYFSSEIMCLLCHQDFSVLYSAVLQEEQEEQHVSTQLRGWKQETGFVSIWLTSKSPLCVFLTCVTKYWRNTESDVGL